METTTYYVINFGASNVIIIMWQGREKCSPNHFKMLVHEARFRALRMILKMEINYLFTKNL